MRQVEKQRPADRGGVLVAHLGDGARQPTLAGSQAAHERRRLVIVTQRTLDQRWRGRRHWTSARLDVIFHAAPPSSCSQGYMPIPRRDVA